MLTDVLKSPVARGFAVGFREIEKYRLPHAGVVQTADVRVLKDGAVVKTATFINAVSATDPQTPVNIELVTYKPIDGKGGVVLFECVLNGRPASGLADLTTGEVVLGFEDVPI
ncbi:MAG: hypothetical protein M1275_00535 [Patescibacteria group bacterium]|nr:hypothetical protein [Patescibacteria group bacterium]